MPRKTSKPLSEEVRMDLLRRMRETVDQQEAVVWETAAAFLDTGSDPSAVADALGVSRATLYRRLRELRTEDRRGRSH